MFMTDLDLTKYNEIGTENIRLSKRGEMIIVVKLYRNVNHHFYNFTFTNKRELAYLNHSKICNE